MTGDCTRHQAVQCRVVVVDSTVDLVELEHVDPTSARGKFFFFKILFKQKILFFLTPVAPQFTKLFQLQTLRTGSYNKLSMHLNSFGSP